MKIKKLINSTLLAAAFVVSTGVYAATATTNTTTATATAAATEFNPGQVQQIQQVVHDYLLQNPQLMVQIFQKLQTQQQADMQQHAIKAIQANAATIFNDANSPVAGNAKGTVTLVEFFDYQCPHCKEMATVISGLVNQDKNLKVVFKEFPIFPGSMYAAQAALAAQLQGKYWPFHNALMAANNPLQKNDVLAAASKVGLDVTQLEKDIGSATIQSELQQNEQLADKLGLAGTPAFIIQSNNDKTKTFFVPGQVGASDLQQLIKKAS